MYDSVFVWQSETVMSREPFQKPQVAKEKSIYYIYHRFYICFTRVSAPRFIAIKKGTQQLPTRTKSINKLIFYHIQINNIIFVEFLLLLKNYMRTAQRWPKILFKSVVGPVCALLGTTKMPRSRQDALWKFKQEADSITGRLKVDSISGRDGYNVDSN